MSHKIKYEGLEKKVRLRWKIGIVAFDVLFVALEMLIFFLLLRKYPNIKFEKATMIITVLSVAVIVPSIQLSDFIIEKFSPFYREDNKKFKEKQMEHEKQNEEIKTRLNLPDGVMTSYDYNKLHFHDEIPTKTRWAVCIIFECLCLFLTIGLAFYGEFLSPLLIVSSAFLGLFCGIYGFAFLCNEKIKGLYYSFCPVACFGLPFLIMYLCGIRTALPIVLVTILIGGAIFYFVLRYVLLKPYIDKNKVEKEYYEKFYENCPSALYFDNCIPINAFSNKYGKHAQIFQQYSDKLYNILVYDKIIYKGVKLENVLVLELKDIHFLEDAEKLVIEHLLV